MYGIKSCENVISYTNNASKTAQTGRRTFKANTKRIVSAIPSTIVITPHTFLPVSLYPTKKANKAANGIGIINTRIAVIAKDTIK